MGAFPTNRYQTYQTKSVFVSSGAADTDQTVSGSLRQLSRLQGWDWNTPYPVEMVTYLDAGSDAYESSHTPVNVDISYYHTNGRNEQYLGLIDTVGLNGNLTLNLEQEKNLYLVMENVPGVDAIGAPTGIFPSKSVIAMGQALMTTYNMNARVGGIIQSRVTMNCLTAYSYTGNVGNKIPAVNYQDGTQKTGLFVIPQAVSQYDVNATGISNPLAASAISARDMIMVFAQDTPFGITFSGANECYLQGFDVTLSMDRRELKPLGSIYPPTRALHYPIRIDLSTDAIVNQYQKDQLDRIDCLGSGQSVYLIVKQPCSNMTLFGFYFDKLQIESQNFSTSIGQTDTVSIKWKGLITSPYTVFFSAAANGLFDANTQQPYGTQW